MSNGINLLRRRQTRQIEREKRIVKTLQIVSVVSLVIVTGVSVFFFFLSATSPYESLKNEEKNLLSNLLAQNAKSVKLILTTGRVKDISNIITNRSNVEKAVDAVTNVLPKDIIIDSFLLEKSSITLTFRSVSLVSVDIFLNSLIDMIKEKKYLSRATVKQLNVDPKLGLYIINMSFDLYE